MSPFVEKPKVLERFLAGFSRRAEWSGGPPIANVLMARVLAQPDIISLAAGFVEHNSLPVEPVARAMERLLADRRVALEALQYGSTLGHPRLRQLIWDRVCQADVAASVPRGSPDHIVITAGSNQLLYLIAEALLDPGDIILCGSPTYFVFLGMVQSFGARTIGVASDQDGIIPEALEERLTYLESLGELERVKAIYVATYYDNPTGTSLGRERRPLLVEIAQRWSKRHRLYIIEDCAYRDLRFQGDDWPSVRAFDSSGHHVVQTGSFSKSFSPGIRVGWGILPPALLEPVLSLKGHLDFGSANFNQMLMATVLEHGWFDQHVQDLREIYRTKAEVLMEAVEDCLRPVVPIHYIRPGGGLYLWLQLPADWETGVDGPLFAAAVDEGVVYVPGEYCFPAEGEPALRHCLRLSYAMPDPTRLREGVERLARAVRRVMASAKTAGTAPASAEDRIS